MCHLAFSMLTNVSSSIQYQCMVLTIFSQIDFSKCMNKGENILVSLPFACMMTRAWNFGLMMCNFSKPSRHSFILSVASICVRFSTAMQKSSWFASCLWRNILVTFSLYCECIQLDILEVIRVVAVHRLKAFQTFLHHISGKHLREIFHSNAEVFLACFLLLA